MSLENPAVRLGHTLRQLREERDRSVEEVAAGIEIAPEDLLESAVCHLRVGDRGAATQIVNPPSLVLVGGCLGLRFKNRVDSRVHTRDEERRHRSYLVQPLPVDCPALQRAEIPLHHPLITFEREEQRNVDVDALEQCLLDCGKALFGPRDLDHDIGAFHSLPQAAGVRPQGAHAQ